MRICGHVSYKRQHTSSCVELGHRSQYVTGVMTTRASLITLWLCLLGRNGSAIRVSQSVAGPRVTHSRRCQLLPPSPKRCAHRPVHLEAAREGQGAPEVLDEIQQKNQKTHEQVWASRRAMARATLSAARSFRTVREVVAGSQVEGDGDGEDGKDTLVSDSKGALVISAVGLAVAAATLRLGGRAALVSVSRRMRHIMELSHSQSVEAFFQRVNVHDRSQFKFMLRRLQLLPRLSVQPLRLMYARHRLSQRQSIIGRLPLNEVPPCEGIHELNQLPLSSRSPP